MSVSSLEHAAITAEALGQLAELHDLAASIPARIAEVEEKYVSAIQGLGFPLPEIARGEGTGALAPVHFEAVEEEQIPDGTRVIHEARILSVSLDAPADAGAPEAPAAAGHALVEDPPHPTPDPEPAPEPPPDEREVAEAPRGGRPLAAGTRQMLEVVERAGEAGATAADVAAVLNVMQGDVTTKLTALSYAARPRVVRKPNTNPVVWVCTSPLDDGRAALQRAALQAAGVEE